MTLRLTPRALAEAKRIKSWWRRHRLAAPDLFEQEFVAALDRIAQLPGAGKLYEEGDLEVCRWRRQVGGDARRHGRLP